MTPITWNENTEAVPAGWIWCGLLWLMAKSSSSRRGDVLPQRKHEKHESHGRTQREGRQGSGFVEDAVAACGKHEETISRGSTLSSSNKHFMSLFQLLFVRLTDCTRGFIFIHYPSVFSPSNIHDMHIDCVCHFPHSARSY